MLLATLFKVRYCILVFFFIISLCAKIKMTNNLEGVVGVNLLRITYVQKQVAYLLLDWRCLWFNFAYFCFKLNET